MKYYIILILLLISLSLSNNVKYSPIKKFGEMKIDNFIDSFLIFALDISEMKNNEEIYLKYASSIKINSSLIQYAWKKEYYKNLTFINSTEFNYINNIKCVTRDSQIFNSTTYSIYCSINKTNNSNNTLMIYVKQIKFNNITDYSFEIYHKKYNIIKIIHIIAISIAVFIISEILFGSCYYYSRYRKYKNFKYENQNGIINKILPNDNYNNNEKYNPPTSNI